MGDSFFGFSNVRVNIPCFEALFILGLLNPFFKKEGFGWQNRRCKCYGMREPIIKYDLTSYLNGKRDFWILILDKMHDFFFLKNVNMMHDYKREQSSF